MKNKNIINEYIRLFFTVFLAVFLVFFIYFAGVYIFVITNGDYSDGYKKVTSPSEYFNYCDIKYKRCINPDCGLYTFCNDKDYDDCEIYDCGEYYGVAVKDKYKGEYEGKSNRS
jgi:hypothetical protein